MPLQPGHRFGPYEILSPLGAGGMGEVYRAKDTRLGREVAIKVLPQTVGADPQRLARFEREAQLLAALNHPNIAAIHGVEEADGVLALVLELVDGPTLEERLHGGALPLDEALPIARQIAEAVEAAHESGIVHRDLKPANIKLTADGRVKVLDFGLAKALAGDASSAGDVSMSPTLTAAATAAGVILGTAAYMSPEQAKGRGVDRRSDIWNFGIVVLEMLSGRRAFEGETITEVLAAIMKDPIPFDRLPAETPHALRLLLERCLERDPKRRLQAIGEARIALEGMLGAGGSSSATSAGAGMTSSGLAPGASVLTSAGIRRDPSSSGAAVASPGRGRLASSLPWAIAALGLALAAGLWLREGRGTGAGPGAVLRKFSIDVGSLDFSGRRPAVLSPDGRRIAFVNDGGLWIRDLFSLEARLLVSAKGRPPDEVPSNPIWSPDSRQIAYVGGARLWKAPVEGGSPTAVCSVGDGFSGATWLPDDRIVYTVPRGNMLEVSARGGDPKVLLARDEAADIDFHDPWGLPGGRGIVYALHRKEGVDTIELLADGERKQLPFAGPNAPS